MKTTCNAILRGAAVAVLALGVFAFSGCAPAGDSIRDVIDDFIAAVNAGDAGDIKAVLDSNADAYSLAGTITFWTASYFDESPYSISSFKTSGNNATVTFKPASGTNKIYYFEMTEKSGTMTEGGTYKIRRIRVTNSSGSPIFE